MSRQIITAYFAFTYPAPSTLILIPAHGELPAQSSYFREYGNRARHPISNALFARKHLDGLRHLALRKKSNQSIYPARYSTDKMKRFQLFAVRLK
ncbi:hypothetical protein ATHEMM101B_10295 [Atlantibacter hermannii]